MNLYDTLHSAIFKIGVPALLASVLSSLAQASTIEISARFSPNPANPHLNEFINTTPDSGLCRTFPSMCRPRGLHSIRLGLEAQSLAPLRAGQTDVRQGVMIKVPTDADITVTSLTGHKVDLKFSVVAFSGTNRTRDVRQIVGRPNMQARYANNVLWNGYSWGYYPTSPCTLAVGISPTRIDADYFWFTPPGEACGKTPAFEIDRLLLRNAAIAYQMTTPNPLSMESGTYRGSITYSVGPGGDFDFGDVLEPTTNNVTLNFTLEVQHTLKFQFPAGGHRLALNPAGGWQQWLNHGRRPQKLLADQDFKIWSSTLFSMRLQCEHSMGAHCGIKNPAGDTIPVETRITLPAGLRDESNRAVSRYPLSPDPVRFRPTYYVDNGRAALHFEVGRDQVKGMIDDHSGSTYSGNVTIIWDSSLTP